MAEEKSSILSKINPTTALAVLAVIGSIYVTYYQVGELVEDNASAKKERTSMHDEMDLLKIRITQELYEIKLEVKDEKIERLESQLEYYKNK